MYARDYRQNKSGAVRAFEDAYAKECFLKQTASSAMHQTCTGRESPYENAENNAARSAGSAHPDARSGGGRNENFTGYSSDAGHERQAEFNGQACDNECGASSRDAGLPERRKSEGGGISKIFGDADTGDILLLFLILFFLMDSDKENDSLIPIILAVLLLF